MSKNSKGEKSALANAKIKGIVMSLVPKECHDARHDGQSCAIPIENCGNHSGLHDLTKKPGPKP